MPKLGMGPIRREQICRAAAAVIAREGFAGSTMRMVAEEAGVSTGMLNHYFENREDLLTQALLYVSERTQQRFRDVICDVPAGIERLQALLDSTLAGDEEMIETWRVWINAYGVAVRTPGLRHTIEVRLLSWYELIDLALEGLVPPDAPGSIPASWRFDALLNGYMIQALTSEAALDATRIREEVIALVLAGAAPQERRGSSARSRRVAVGG